MTQALGEEHRQFDQTRSDFAPWRDAGSAALGQQGDLTGIHGNDPQAAAIAQLQGSPLYQSLYRNGIEAAAQNASATGGLRGGNAQHSFYDVGQDTLAQVIQQQLGNLGALSGQGLQATNSTANSGDQLTQAIASILGTQGQVRSGGILTRGAINQNMWNNAGAFGDQAASAIAGGGGGGLGSILSSILGGKGF